MGACGPFLKDISVPVWKDARTEDILGWVRLAVYCTCWHIGVGGVFFFFPFSAINRLSMWRGVWVGRSTSMFVARISFERVQVVYVCLVLLQGIIHTHTHLSKNVISYVIMLFGMRLVIAKHSASSR